MILELPRKALRELTSRKSPTVSEPGKTPASHPLAEKPQAEGEQPPSQLEVLLKSVKIDRREFIRGALKGTLLGATVPHLPDSKTPFLPPDRLPPEEYQLIMPEYMQRYLVKHADELHFIAGQGIYTLPSNAELNGTQVDLAVPSENFFWTLAGILDTIEDKAKIFSLLRSGNHDNKLHFGFTDRFDPNKQKPAYTEVNPAGAVFRYEQGFSTFFLSQNFESLAKPGFPTPAILWAMTHEIAHLVHFYNTAQLEQKVPNQNQYEWQDWVPEEATPYVPEVYRGLKRVFIPLLCSKEYYVSYGTVYSMRPSPDILTQYRENFLHPTPPTSDVASEHQMYYSSWTNNPDQPKAHTWQVNSGLNMDEFFGEVLTIAAFRGVEGIKNNYDSGLRKRLLYTIKYLYYGYLKSNKLKIFEAQLSNPEEVAALKRRDPIAVRLYEKIGPAILDQLSIPPNGLVFYPPENPDDEPSYNPESIPDEVLLSHPDIERVVTEMVEWCCQKIVEILYAEGWHCSSDDPEDLQKGFLSEYDVVRFTLERGFYYDGAESNPQNPHGLERLQDLANQTSARYASQS